MQKALVWRIAVAASLALLATFSAYADDPFGKYSPAITMTSVGQINGAVKFPEGQDWTNNNWTQDFADKLGINVKYDWVTDTASFPSKLQITIASGDFPDFALVDMANFVKLQRAGQLANLQDAYDKFASPDLKAAMDNFKEGFRSGMIGGKLYGLSPQFWGMVTGPQTLWIRSDWLTKYKLQPPKTMADLEKIATTFMKGEGKGAFGISLSNDSMMYGSMNTLRGWANGLHAYPHIWIKDAHGHIVYGSIQPEMKAALKYFQDWAKKGLINKEFGVKNTDAANADMLSGKVGITFGDQWLSFWPFNDAATKDQTVLWQAYTIPSIDSKPVKVQAAWPIGSVYVVNAKSAHPEAIIKMANEFVKLYFHDSPETFLRMVNPTGKDSTYWNCAPVNVIDPSYEENQTKLIWAALKNGDTSKLIVPYKGNYDEMMKWVNDKDPAGYGRYYQMGPKGSYTTIIPFVDSGNYVLNELRGPDTPTLAKNRSTLETLESNAFTKIILGVAPLDSFDQFVADWKKLGGDQITKEVNDTYGSP